MGRKGGFAVAAICAVSLAPLAPHAQPAPDPVDKMALLGAPFVQNSAQPKPERVTAMAFLPGRGVISWDITGKTAEEAREAQIEAMGLADARAVQQEIDEAAAEKAAELQTRQAAEQGSGGEARSRRLALNASALAGSPREAGEAILVSHAARSGGRLGVRNGDAVRGKARMFAFAAASGRGVGLNVLHDDAGWKNGGLTTDRDGGYSGQKQAGLAWRKGLVQTSLSYVQQKDHLQMLGVQTDKDHRLMLTLNMPPQAILGLFRKKP